MSLQPVDPILNTILTIAEKNPRAAQELVRLSLYESLTEQVEKARPRLERDGAKWMASQVLKARATFDNAGVSKAMAGDPETAEILEGLDAIEVYIQKDLLGHALAFFNRLHPRDEKGQFIRRDVAPSGAASSTVRGGQHQGRIETYIDQWRKNKLIDDNTRVAVHWKDSEVDPRTNKIVIIGRDETMTHHKVGDLMANNGAGLSQLLAAQGDDQTPIGVSFDRRGIPMEGRERRGALDATAMFTGSSGIENAASILQRLPSGSVNADQAAGNWNRPGSPGDRQSYRRLSMTGSALQTVSAEGSIGDTVGTMARLIGDLGPEAEKVFGPGVRRTAYRYRGTEKRPDPGVVRAVEVAHQYAAAMSGSDEISAEDKLALEQTLKLAPKGETEPELGVAQHYARDRFRSWSTDRLELAMQGDAAAVTLLEAVPNQKLAAVSIEAGELPPSQGVIIDADGDIVSQAQGFNGDHYLPFDLKNIADLHGGQYVRTRAAGGPTTEDIYTGLLAGARQVQVVSNSGVYTVEFDPDVRGGRRYSDKALRMIQRYGHLLEAIEGGKLYENDVDSQKRSELRTKAYESVGWDPDLGARRYTELLNKERLQATVNQEDEDALYERAIALVDEADQNRRNSGAGGYSNQARAAAIQDTVRDLKSEANEKKVRQMVLDGKGYATALSALKQEFPFYIRDVRYETVDDFATARKARTNPHQGFDPYTRDRGYTERGQTNAKATLTPGGVMAGRRVPTGQSGTAGAEVGGEQRQGAGVARQTQQVGGQSGTAQTQAAPVRDGNVVAPIVTGTKTFDQIMGPGSPTEDNLRNALGHVMPIMQNYYDANPDFSPLDEKVEVDAIPGSASPIDVAFHIAVTKYARKPREVANWLYNVADDDQRNQFIEGLHQVREMTSKWRDPDTKAAVGDEYLTRHAGSVAQFDEDLERVERLVALKQPFAEPAENMAMAIPESGKPQPWPAVVQLGDKVANYEKYLQQAESDDPALFAAINEAASKPDDVIDSIEKLLHQHKLEEGKEAPDQDKLMALTKELEVRQRAWAFDVAYDIAQEVDEGKEEAPEQGPTKPVEKAHQRRVLVFHSPSEAFSKRVLQGRDLSQ